MLLIAIIFCFCIARKYNKLYYILLTAILICLIRTCLGEEYEATYFFYLKKTELILYMVFFYKSLIKGNNDLC